MEIIISKTCAFTGHRPHKISGDIEAIKMRLEKEIRKQVELGINTFITGMALGTDMWAAECVLKLKKENNDIKLVCAIPFPGVENNRTEEEQNYFRSVVASADKVEYVSPKYNRWCFQKRDRWMIDHSKNVIAVFNGTPGGTASTIAYARENGIIPVIIKIPFIDTADVN